MRDQDSARRDKDVAQEDHLRSLTPRRTGGGRVNCRKVWDCDVRLKESCGLRGGSRDQDSVGETRFAIVLKREDPLVVSPCHPGDLGLTVNRCRELFGDQLT